nr:reductive dehalogenase [uncultured bacterium]UZH91618.1 reductive dehalogenase [uncultured bacterium]
MNKFHSTLTRRDFMKGLGLAGAGLGAAMATTPAFHDLDEVIASSNGGFQRPWWVKERGYDDPTCEIDWNQMERADNSWTMHGVRNGLKGGYLFAGDKYLQWHHEASEAAFNGVKNDTPGFTLRDMALESGASPALGGLGNIVNYVLPKVNEGDVLAKFGITPAIWPQASFLWGSAATPEFWGVSKWQGTPEENSRMMRSAMRFLGASQVRFGELNEKTRKLIFTHHVHNTPVVFENVDQAYEVPGEKFVLPDNKPLYFMSVAIQMSKEMYRQGNGAIRYAANNIRYRLNSVVQTATQSFLSGLGYQGIGYPSESLFHGFMPAQADAILTGFAEMARNNNYCISPEYGTVAGYFSILTDLPLAPDKPIDAGYFRFCHTCRKCAEVCPSQAISFDSEPSWEIPPSAVDPTKETKYSTPGKNVFHTDSPACYSNWIKLHGCARCMGTCVFNTNTNAMVHDVVRATVGATGLFNGFLWNADKAFGYGLVPDEQKEEWWDRDYPVLGQDSTIGSYNGGY